MKQRLVGAAVLVALAVIFLPMLVQGPAPDSGVSDVPLTMPDAPEGDYQTRDLPLVMPEGAPSGGALGMDAPIDAAPGAGDRLPTVDTAATAAAGSQPPASEALDGGMMPPATAGGDYAVHFGSYATASGASAVVAQLLASQLPGYREQTTLDGKPAWRVRIGPYATRADAEAARLRAAHVRDDVGARVVTLDAETASRASQPVAPPATPTVATQPLPPAPQSATAPAQAAKPVATAPAATTPAAAAVGFAVQLGAFGNATEAGKLRDRVRAAGFSAFTETVSTDKGALTRVRVGPVGSRADADALKAQLRAKVGVDGIVRPHP